VTINAHDPSHPQGFVTIVACPGGSDQTTLAEMQANAQLIALAPEKAETLRAIDGLMDCEAYDPQDVQAMMARVTAHVNAILSRLPVAK
jgi:malonyl CoA-acyl carrier protein transacylase